MKISEILQNKKTSVSFEFFPPKKLENEHILFETIEELKKYKPDFVSITYGAGGSSRDKTLEWTKIIKDRFMLNVMMHLTCVAQSKEDVDSIIDSLKSFDIKNILALRGDLPEGFPNEMIKKDFLYASELVDYLKNKNGFSIGVAGYPEGHIHSENIEKDIEYLKKKVDLGADFIITQLFFDNRYFFRFMEIIQKNNINVPVIAGIMPITNINQIMKFTKMCGASVPDDIVKSMEEKDEEYVLKKGVDYAISQCLELLSFGVKGLHFYTLNKSESTSMVLKEILGKI